MMIIDFLKSFFRYPEIVKKLEAQNKKSCNIWSDDKFPRGSYALWCCRLQNVVASKDDEPVEDYEEWIEVAEDYAGSEKAEKKTYQG